MTFLGAEDVDADDAGRRAAIAAGGDGAEDAREMLNEADEVRVRSPEPQRVRNDMAEVGEIRGII
jgi:hypothetical protein